MFKDNTFSRMWTRVIKKLKNLMLLRTSARMYANPSSTDEIEVFIEMFVFVKSSRRYYPGAFKFIVINTLFPYPIRCHNQINSCHNYSYFYLGKHCCLQYRNAGMMYLFVL